VGPHYYQRRDVEFPESNRQLIVKRLQESRPENIGGVKVARLDTMDGFRFILADNSWMLIRFSGTEPLLRIYAECSSTADVESLLNAGRELAGV